MVAGKGRTKDSKGPVIPISQAPSSSAASSQTTPDHKACFSKHQKRTQWEPDEDPKERRICGLCCAWSAIIIGCFIMGVLVVGGMYLSFLQNALPQFYVKAMKFTKLKVNTKNLQTMLTADLELQINATNKNDKYDLSYGLFKVEVWSDDIKLGTTEVPPFEQKARKMTVVKLKTGVENSLVNGDDADELVKNWQNRHLTLNMVFRGSISFNFEGRHVNDLPLTVSCEKVVISEIDAGRQPVCHAKMFKFGFMLAIKERHAHGSKPGAIYSAGALQLVTKQAVWSKNHPHNLAPYVGKKEE
ncbi:hypothetical protein HYC85_031542 [Camellia sinensis]|uniref:Late embryogenesis abundant protein LEA-2 subgroup domain-containing protein n=1 Tax=Camellia sinensis TaxID=4442 RepID=A0A7J7FR28_CAMSI|nr:hypothetical protein HYC85_031542 [Camellia sinensis]